MEFVDVFFDPEQGGLFLAGVVVLLLSGYVAAPAIASMGLIALDRRWPLFWRSAIAAGVAAIAMTVAAGVAWIGGFILVADDYSEHKGLYRLLPFLALGAVAVAALVQDFNRTTFSRTRGIGIACAAAVPVVVLTATIMSK